RRSRCSGRCRRSARSAHRHPSQVRGQVARGEDGAMRVCLVQLEVTLAEPLEERVAQATELIRGCAGADLVVLPELWAQGAWAYQEWAQTAEPLDGPTVTALAQAAKDAGVMLHGGSIVERSGDSLFNTSVLFGEQGDLRAIYRKIHRFGFA